MHDAILPPGRTTFRADATPGWWRCQTCWGGTFRALPTPREEAEATRTARAQARAAVVAEAEARAVEATRTAWRSNRLTPALVRGMVEALLHRAVPQRYPATPASRTWRDHCPLRELIRDYLDAAGHPLVDVQAKGHALAMRALRRTGAPAFQPIAARAQGFLTTSDLPGLLDNVARTIFLDAYGDTVRSFVDWTTAVEVPDFRSTIISSAEFPDLLLVPEHGEYVAGWPFGPTTPVRLAKYGRTVDFTEQALLRDDVAEFGQLQQALGVAAAQVENDVVYDLLTSNPTLPDGQPLFSAAHQNLLPAAALDAASLAAACTRLAANSAHGRPAFLLVGTALGPQARELAVKQTPPNAGEASGVLEVIQDDRITGGWYVTCDPHERPTLVTAHLAMADGPELLSRDAWDIDARSYKARLEFGAAVVSATAMVYTPTV
jgi:hypothetical protein